MKNLWVNLNRLIFFTILYGIICTNTVFAKVTPIKSTESYLTTIFERNAETVNLTETLILISKDWDPSLDEKPLRNEINQLVASVKDKLKSGMTARVQLIF